MELDNFAAHLETVFMTDYLKEKNGAASATEDIEDYRPGGNRQESEPSGAATGH
jgi:biopolymer transport protein ExbB/biopolymer transport protein TolQ